MAALPLVLAGPILRRVEPGRVTVWIALSAPADVSLHIFEGREESTGPGTIAHAEPILSRTGVPTWGFGERLHIAVVEASMPAEAGGVDIDGRGVEWTNDAARPAVVVGPAPAPLQPGAFHCYDVVITRDGEAKGLLALGLLADDPAGASTTRSLAGVDKAAPRHLALGYADKILPSFVVPAAEVDKICLAHASCRKIHGPGTDAMSFLDAEVEEHIDDPGKRVQQLFLTGDQIYADDVGATILPVIHDLAVQLNLEDHAGADTPDHLATGMEELPKKDATVVQYFSGAAGIMGNVTMQSAGPLRRSKIIRRDAGFTSTGATNHLMTFAEYAALYLLAWSPRVWKLPADDDRVFEHAEASESPFSQFDLSTMIEQETSEPTLRAALDRRFGQALEGERQRIKVYAATVGKVARLLANTPTYMIFDDHDVTDDWNINAVFMQRVYARPMGRMVVREALTAYLAFQGIGNDVRQYSKAEALRAMPRKFEKHPTSNEAIEIAQQPIDRADYEFLDAATKYLATPRNRPRAEAKKLDTLFGFPESGSSDPDKRLSFHYRLQCGLYDVLVLDSRTRRTFDGMLYGPSQLLGDTLEEQVPKDPRSGVTFNLVVSSTPILGPELFERIALPALITIKGAKKPLTDFERQDERPEQGTPEKDAARRTRGALDMDLETWSANEAGQHELLERLTSFHPVIMLG
ncbi:MAG TPA: hypothetical protein VM913_04710, partial [Sphingomicrobium sp.]|nr:hypothetical protein [Sphingomicrobium sp.]